MGKRKRFDWDIDDESDLGDAQARRSPGRKKRSRGDVDRAMSDVETQLESEAVGLGDEVAPDPVLQAQIEACIAGAEPVSEISLTDEVPVAPESEAISEPEFGTDTSSKLRPFRPLQQHGKPRVSRTRWGYWEVVGARSQFRMDTVLGPNGRQFYPLLDDFGRPVVLSADRFRSWPRRKSVRPRPPFGVIFRGVAAPTTFGAGLHDHQSEAQVDSDEQTTSAGAATGMSPCRAEALQRASAAAKQGQTPEATPPASSDASEVDPVRIVDESVPQAGSDEITFQGEVRERRRKPGTGRKVVRPAALAAVRRSRTSESVEPRRRQVAVEDVLATLVVVPEEPISSLVRSRPRRRRFPVFRWIRTGIKWSFRAFLILSLIWLIPLFWRIAHPPDPMRQLIRPASPTVAGPSLDVPQIAPTDPAGAFAQPDRPAPLPPMLTTNEAESSDEWIAATRKMFARMRTVATELPALQQELQGYQNDGIFGEAKFRQGTYSRKITVWLRWKTYSVPFEIGSIDARSKAFDEAVAHIRSGNATETDVDVLRRTFFDAARTLGIPIVNGAPVKDLVPTAPDAPEKVLEDLKRVKAAVTDG